MQKLVLKIDVKKTSESANAKEERGRKTGRNGERPRAQHIHGGELRDTRGESYHVSSELPLGQLSQRLLPRMSADPS